MRDLYPGYDVLSKRNSPSWNEKTRSVIDQRLSIDPDAHVFFLDAEWLILRALCDRIIPQPVDRPRLIPIAAMVDQKMHQNQRDGYRLAALPPMREAWRCGLAALDSRHSPLMGAPFASSRSNSRTLSSSLCNKASYTMTRGKGCRRRVSSSNVF